MKPQRRGHVVTLCVTISATAVRQAADMDELSFGVWLRRRRGALDMTQADLGRRVGVAAASIRKIEADERRPSIQVAERLAEALAVPPAKRALFVRAARGELACLPELAAVERVVPAHEATSLPTDLAQEPLP